MNFQDTNFQKALRKSAGNISSFISKILFPEDNTDHSRRTIETINHHPLPVICHLTLSLPRELNPRPADYESAALAS